MKKWVFYASGMDCTWHCQNTGLIHAAIRKVGTFPKMSLLIKNYSAVGTERNLQAGAAYVELLHTQTHRTALPSTPHAAHKQCGTLKGQLMTAGLGFGERHIIRCPRTKARP